MTTHTAHTDRDWLFWLDFETTGLDTTTCAPLEYCAQITTMHDPLTVLARHQFPIDAAVVDLESMDPVVRDMHAESGLLDAIADHGISESVARDRLATFVRAAAYDSPGRVLLAGSGVRFDWDLCNMRWGRDVLAPLHYRQIDVSVLRETALSVGAPVYQRARPHRAAADVHDSRAEFAFYQSVMAGRST